MMNGILPYHETLLHCNTESAVLFSAERWNSGNAEGPRVTAPLARSRAVRWTDRMWAGGGLGLRTGTRRSSGKDSPSRGRPAEPEDRTVPGHWEADLILDLDRSATGTLIERTTRFTLPVHSPCITGHGQEPRVYNRPVLAGHGTEAVHDAFMGPIITLPEQLRRSLTWDRRCPPQGLSQARPGKGRRPTISSASTVCGEGTRPSAFSALWPSSRSPPRAKRPVPRNRSTSDGQAPHCTRADEPSRERFRGSPKHSTVYRKSSD
jgi:hypothetical protein